jgi:hypothetical protein
MIDRVEFLGKHPSASGGHHMLFARPRVTQCTLNSDINRLRTPHTGPVLHLVLHDAQRPRLSADCTSLFEMSRSNSELALVAPVVVLGDVSDRSRCLIPSVVREEPIPSRWRDRHGERNAFEPGTGRSERGAHERAAFLKRSGREEPDLFVRRGKKLPACVSADWSGFFIPAGRASLGTKPPVKAWSE